MSEGSKQYHPQLDSLRAFAVILVIISHWFDKNHLFNRYTANGILGVTLFFVLSGFLITGILLRSKLQLDNMGTLKDAFRIFYLRRSLRIFPVYYLLLLLLIIWDIANIRDSFWWHFFYCSNFYFWIQTKFSGSLSHLWSLSVEEQFYLLWPAIIIFVRRRALVGTFLAGIVIAVLFRCFITTRDNEIGRILMPGSLDSFCIGALIAYGRNFFSNWYKWYVNNRTWFVGGSFILLVLVHTPFFRKLNTYFELSFYFLIISFVFGIWIDRVADTINKSLLGKILNNKMLIYIGKISYGLYLFHNFIPFFYGIDLPGILQPISLYIIQMFRFFILVGLASLSWFLFEKPILSLKERFTYIDNVILKSS